MGELFPLPWSVRPRSWGPCLIAADGAEFGALEEDDRQDVMERIVRVMNEFGDSKLEVEDEDRP